MSNIKVVTIAGKQYGIKGEVVSKAYRVTSITGNVSFIISDRLMEGSEQITLTDKSGNGPKLVLWLKDIKIYGDSFTIAKGNSAHNNAMSLIHDAVRIFIAFGSPSNVTLVRITFTRVTPTRTSKPSIIPPEGPNGFGITNPDSFTI